MRIGIFSECYKPTVNGVVISIETFRQELEKLGHEIYIFAPKTKNYKDDLKNVFRYSSTTLIGPKDYPLALPFFSPQEYTKIEKLNLDIIHTQHMFLMGKLGLKVAKKLNIPVVHTYHTLIAEYNHYMGAFSKITKLYLKNYSRNYCNACDAVITPSKPMADILKTYGIKKQLNVIPTGIEIEQFQNPFTKKELEEKYKIKLEGKKVLLYLSRIAKEKNLDFFFRAIKKLALKRNDFHLIMVGGGPELDFYKNLVQNKKLAEIVTFTGMVPKDQGANKFYGAADLYVFPSVTETQGIVVAEAMAAGTPVVAVNKMGPSTIITNGVDGFLTAENIEQFCEKIELLLDDEKLRNEFAKNGQENAQKYSAASCAKKMEELYEQTIKQFETETRSLTQSEPA